MQMSANDRCGYLCCPIAGGISIQYRYRLCCAPDHCMMRSAFHAANEKVSELPFLDLGDDARVDGDGKFFGVDDNTYMLNETELPSFISFPFGNGTETSVYVS